MSYVMLFFIKLFDQLLRTNYLIQLNKKNTFNSVSIIGIHQLFYIYIIVKIATDFTLPSIIALVSSTMLGTYLTMKKESVESSN